MIKNKFLARTALVFGSVACVSLPSGIAQEVYSNIIGAVSMKVPAESDLLVTPSFANSAVFRAQAASAAAGSVTFADAGFEANAYASGYTLLIEEGTLAGRMFEISANTATTLTLVDSGSELGAASLKTAAIVPELTLGGMFPNGVGGKSEINPGNPEIIVFFNDNTKGVKGFYPDAFYYFSDYGTSPAWRKVGRPLDESANSDVVPLGEGFVIRNESGVDVSFFLFGEVMQSTVRIPISSVTTGSTDNLVGAPRPLAITLGELGLAGADGVIATTSSANDVKDTVRVFLSETTGKNRAPDAIYCYYTDGWRKVVDDVVDLSGGPLGSTAIPAAAALVVRKAPTAQAETVYWTNNWDLPSES